MKTFLTVCILSLSVVSCTKWQDDYRRPVVRRDVIYVSSWKENYTKEILAKCRKESAVLALANYEARGRVQSKEEVVEMERFILWSCYRHFGIMI